MPQTLEYTAPTNQAPIDLLYSEEVRVARAAVEEIIRRAAPVLT